MNVVITSEVLQAYFLCPRKAYLLMYGKDRGTLHEYEQILRKHQLANQFKNLELLKQKHTDVYPYSISNLKEGYEFLIDANLATDNLQAYCSILTRTNELSYEPTIFIGTHTIHNTDKLSLMFAGHVLTKIQGKLSVVGHIVNMKGESRRLKLEESQKVLMPLLEPLQKWLDESSPEEPPVILNKHCHTCQFKEQCKAKAIQEDNLSLLDKVTPKIVRQYERKGIFTVKQLSYLFKPRKRKKRVKNPPLVTHNVELQALAIRTGKIYLQELPVLARQETELYLDIEGLPDQNLYYLIGLLVCQEDKVVHHSFWANETNDESKMWREFIDFVSQHPNASIYHYGSYEPRAIEALSRRYKTDSRSIIEQLTNVNKQIYGKVYFPVYSNQLKEIANFIGATWTSSNASGLQSLVWRHYWNDTNDKQYKSNLLVYNEEDCRALKFLVEELTKIKDSADTLSSVDFADQQKRKITETGQEIQSQFKEILRFAHFKYDQKKISFQSIKNGCEQNTSELQREEIYEICEPPINARNRPGKFVEIPLDNACPKCGYSPLKQTSYISKRFIIDLVLTKSGIKKTVTHYSGTRGYCRNCQRSYAPKIIRQYSNQIYGHGFGAWVAYHRVGLRLPYESIVESSIEHFHEEITLHHSIKLIKRLAKYYVETENSIINNLLKSPFIHVDETNVNIKGINWYVWVFTNEREVVFRLTETRETTIVHNLLEGYKGILISDFYSGYDAVECNQQKCWVHLIRDLNEDLRANPFDQEFEIFITEVRNLIIPMMETIQKYGLKKRNLNKFEKQVERFYDEIVDKQYKSDLTLKYQKRFNRYRDSLFTFLSEDGVPWHNNTAERAIRPFAIQRDVSKSPFHESTTHGYLTLLSIRQTCRFQGKSFFKFLFSGETNLDQFEARKRKR